MPSSVRSAIEAYNNMNQIGGRSNNQFSRILQEAEASYHMNKAMIERSLKNPIENISSNNSIGSLGNSVQNALTGLQTMFYNAEKVSNKALIKQANLTEVVTSLNEVEVALKTLVALRDKSVAAYLDIMKMPI